MAQHWNGIDSNCCTSIFSQDLKSNTGVASKPASALPPSPCQVLLQFRCFICTDQVPTARLLGTTSQASPAKGILTPARSRSCPKSLLAALWQTSSEVPWQPCFKPCFCPLPPSCFTDAEALTLSLPCRALSPNNKGGMSICALCL